MSSYYANAGGELAIIPVMVPATTEPPACSILPAPGYDIVSVADARQYVKLQHRRSFPMPDKQPGFTTVELVTVIVIAAILAAVALPRYFDNNAFESHGFYDQVISTLRYAQKAAIAQNRNVCVVFAANPASVTLTQVAAGGACPGTALASPDGQATYSISSNNASFTTIPANFSFDALGRPSASGVIAVQNVTAITVEAETGYVH